MILNSKVVEKINNRVATMKDARKMACELGVPIDVVVSIVEQRNIKLFKRGIQRNTLLQRNSEVFGLGQDYEIVKRVKGSEYELQLACWLQNRGINFRNENDLRIEGSTKTPDFLLERPHSLTNAKNSQQQGKAMLVNWLESKAIFSDDETHFEIYKTQLLSYRLRYGPGVVIYWFGHTTELKQVDSDILVLCGFPHGLEPISLA